MPIRAELIEIFLLQIVYYQVYNFFAEENDQLDRRGFFIISIVVILMHVIFTCIELVRLFILMG